MARARLRIEGVRDQAARLINAHRDEIAFIHSTTQGIGLIAEGFPFRAGDNVVTAAEEYPSNIFPWMNLESRGVSVRLVESREGRIWLDDLIAAIDQATRLVAISHVEFASGFRNDLDALLEICRARRIALFVDAIQGLGALALDVERTPIDFLAADGHKWLLGPEGAGVLFVRRDWIERLRPIGVGWNSVVGSYNAPRCPPFELKKTAERWEGGSYNMAGILAFGASLGLFLELGIEEISSRVLEHAAAVAEVARKAGWRVCGRVQERDCSGIVALEHPDVDPAQTAMELRREGIVVCCRRGRLRVSPHFYNDESDLDRLRRTGCTPLFVIENLTFSCVQRAP